MHDGNMRRERAARVDLHGHDALTAVDLAVRRVAEAQGNGYDTVELVHGAADVQMPVEEGRGRIKWELRRLASTGQFDTWADPARTWLKAGSIILFLRPNRKARPERWSEEPARRHRR
jgi:hypothetical protein